MKYICLLPLMLFGSYPEPHPIGFSIPESKVLEHIPEKDQDFAYVIPGHQETYIFDQEDEYYKDYQHSFFAITKKKCGWDCLRHYEILANGCIPYFLDLDECPEKTMAFFPKELVSKAMELEGVSYLKIDHKVFDLKRYNEILEELMEHTRKYLTTRAMASYLLDTINYSGFGKILFLSEEKNPDYLRCMTLIGLKEVLGDKIVDVPKIEHIYKTYGDATSLYGKGMSYTNVVEDLRVDRENIEQRIDNREFEFIIYGSIHRGLPLLNLVTQKYPPCKIVYLCGEDRHESYNQHECHFIHLKNLFLREFEDYQ